MENQITHFSAKQLTAKELVDGEDEYNHSPKYKPKDFEQLQAFLNAFDFKWKIQQVHDEPLGEWGRGGKPRIRIEGRLEGDGVTFGTFHVAFGGSRINVILSPERQALFVKTVQALPAPEKR